VLAGSLGLLVASGCASPPRSSVPSARSRNVIDRERFVADCFSTFERENERMRACGVA
jgi:hypothetical protein